MRRTYISRAGNGTKLGYLLEDQGACGAGGGRVKGKLEVEVFNVRRL